jgi:hypothetical protein
MPSLKKQSGTSPDETKPNAPVGGLGFALDRMLRLRSGRLDCQYREKARMREGTT